MYIELNFETFGTTSDCPCAHNTGTDKIEYNICLQKG
jgi:hypothetical protein